MANNSNDIEIVIGVNSAGTKVELEKGLRKVLREINKENTFAGKNGFKIGLKENESKTQIITNLKEVFKKINANSNNSFKINNVSLSNSAVNTLKKQLETALGSIKIKGVTVSGVSTRNSNTTNTKFQNINTIDNEQIVKVYNKYLQLQKQIERSKYSTDDLIKSTKELGNSFSFVDKNNLKFAPITKDELNSINNELTKLKTTFNELQVSNTAFKDTNQINTYKNRIIGVINTVKSLEGDTSDVQNRLQNLLTKLQAPNLTNAEFNKIKASLIEIKSEVQNIKTSANTSSNNTLDKQLGISETSKKIEQLRSSLTDAYTIAKKATEKLTSKEITLIPANTFSNKISGVDGITKSYENVQNSITAYETKIEEVKGKLSELNNLEKGTNVYNKKYEEIEKLKSELSELKTIATNSVNSISNIFNNIPKSVSKTQNSIKVLENLMSHMSTWASQNDRAFRNPKFKATFDEIRSSAEKAKTSIVNLTEAEQRFKVSDLQNQFKQFNNEVTKAGLKGQSFFAKLQAQLSKLGVYFNAIFIFNSIRTQVRKMYANVLELDTAMTELKKVTDETNDAYDKYLTNAINKSKELGATVTDVVNATAAYARLGFSMQDATDVGNASIVYKQVADDIDNIEDANKSIISTMKAYGVSVEDVMTIVDKFNAVSNNLPISAGGIGEALQNSASALAVAGNDLSESLGIIVAGNDVVQDPNSVGTGVKTLSLRIRGARVELEKAGLDTDGMADSISKLRDKIKDLSGVDIMLDENTFKSTYQILQEISKVWDNLADVDKSAITDLMAGKNQANVFSSIMTNFSDAEKTVDIANNSTGSAMEEHSKQLESMQGKLQILQANYEALSQSVMNDGFLKELIDFGSLSLEWLTKINDCLGTMPILISAIATALMTKNNSIMGKPDTIKCVRWFNVNMPIAA